LACRNQCRLASTNTDAAAGTKVHALTQVPVQEIFDQDESCDFETFMELTEEALQEMGVDSFGARYPFFF